MRGPARARPAPRDGFESWCPYLPFLAHARLLRAILLRDVLGGGSFLPLMIGQPQPSPRKHRPAPLVAGHVHQGAPVAAVLPEGFDPPPDVAVEERPVAGRVSGQS